MNWKKNRVGREKQVSKEGREEKRERIILINYGSGKEKRILQRENMSKVERYV